MRMGNVIKECKNMCAHCSENVLRECVQIRPVSRRSKRDRLMLACGRSFHVPIQAPSMAVHMAHACTEQWISHGTCTYRVLAWHWHMHGCSHGTCTCMGARMALAHAGCSHGTGICMGARMALTYACMSHQALAYRPARSSHAYALHGPSNGPCTHAQALHGLSPMHMPCVAHAGLQACTPCMV